jgi:hypothetical protein
MEKGLFLNNFQCMLVIFSKTTGEPIFELK